MRREVLTCRIGNAPSKPNKLRHQDQPARCHKKRTSLPLHFQHNLTGILSDSAHVDVVTENGSLADDGWPVQRLDVVDSLVGHHLACGWGG